MNKHITAEIVLGLALLLCLGLIGWEQYNKAVANGVATATAQILKHAQDEKDSALQARDVQYQKDLKVIEDKYDRLAKMKPEQIIQKVPEYIPLASKPITIWTPGAEPPKDGDAIVPQQDIKPIAQAILDGEKCKLDNAKCSADLIDWKAKYDLKVKESAEWEKAAKGGSWLKRLGNNALKVGIGVGIGYALKH